jgi:Zn-dependent M16 (insulinase) family peptidase
MTTMTMVEGFVLQREAHIPELNTRAKLYRHAKTGAEILSLENDDENKVFGITFRTPVSDSTGVMHILEHSVLGGSKKYPVKEPFIELAKGSLKTFLNALTYPDRTCYPVASTNSQDFYNLMDVYLDAVFNPLLTPEHLQQEGWHYELNAPDEPLTYKGIVFNEMKGAYSSPERALGEQVEKSIFPDNAYHFSSGGDPRNIPDLTYEHFKSTYQTYYHPSNALIFFYGDDDPTERLRRIDAYLRSAAQSGRILRRWTRGRSSEEGDGRGELAAGRDDEPGIRAGAQHSRIYSDWYAGFTVTPGADRFWSGRGSGPTWPRRQHSSDVFLNWLERDCRRRR